MDAGAVDDALCYFPPDVPVLQVSYRINALSTEWDQDIETDSGKCKLCKATRILALVARVPTGLV
jgi:hypothetical protein